MRRLDRPRPLRRALIAVGALVLLLAPAAQARTVTMTGTVRVAHADDLRLRTATPYYVLDTPQRSIRVRPARGLRWYPQTGDVVRVTGRRRGGVLVASRVQKKGATKRLLGGTPVTGTRKVAVILVNFTDRQTTPWTREQIQDRFFDASTSVAAYYQEQSFGELQVTGDVYDWHTIDQPSTSCNFQAWGAAARLAAGVPLSYHHFVYVFPFVPACDWAGLAYLPGAESWINGYPDLRVMGHELGHNLGVHHASTLRCYDGASRVALSTDCDADEYGDPFTIMGGGSRLHFNAFHKAQLGWLPPSGEREATESGTYTLASVSTASAGVQSLRIRRSAGQWIYCDLRSAGGPFEDFSASPTATQGVMVRLGPSYTTRTQPQLVDATPATTSFADAALLPGQSFEDSLSGVRITVDAVAGGSATLRVQFATAGDITPPTPPGAVSASLVGASVQIVWGPAGDDVGVTGYRVYRDGALVATVTPTGWADPAPPPGAQVAYAVAAIDAAGNEGPRRAVLVSTAAPPPEAPGGLAASAETGGVVHLSWAGAVRALRYVVSRDGRDIATVDGTTAADTGLRAGSTYAYAVVALDAGGQRGASSETVLVTVPTDVIDGEPRTDVRAPTAPGRPTLRRLARQRVRLAWRPAHDDVRVAHYRVSVNGRVVRRTRKTAVTLRIGKARRTVTIRAVDAAGNVGRPVRLVVRARG